MVLYAIRTLGGKFFGTVVVFHFAFVAACLPGITYFRCRPIRLRKMMVVQCDGGPPSTGRERSESGKRGEKHVKTVD